jgi:superfamily II DNA/RNA helicase
MTAFEDFQFDSRIGQALEELGFKEPTGIQAQAIPQVMNDRDIIASAQTGTGKTAAFLLPLLHKIANSPREKGIRPVALVLVPTRELAMQVAEEAKKFSKFLKSKTVCIYGGVPYPLQKRFLSSPYDILVATPGRLIDQLQQRKVDLSAIKMLILDEADRMLDMGFIDAVFKIATACPAKRQTLLFSATIDRKILPISQKLQKDPFEIRIEPHKTSNENIDQELYYVDDMNHKMQILEHLLQKEEVSQSIVFTSTKMQAEELSRQLYDMGYQSGSLHGDMNQNQRTRVIGKLKKGDIDVLVATDVAARGIDIATLSHVINFDLPFHAEDFIHRIGRTGRAGAKGTAISFAAQRDALALSRIHKLLGKQLEAKIIPGLEPKKREKKAGPRPFDRRGPKKPYGRKFSRAPQR